MWGYPHSRAWPKNMTHCSLSYSAISYKAGYRANEESIFSFTLKKKEKKLYFRKQFPQTPKTAPILPSWQLVNKDSEVKDEAGDKENRLDAAEKAEDVENTAPLDSQTGNSSDKSEENIKVDEDSSSGDVQHPDSDFGDGVVVNPTSSVESLNAESAVIDEESDSQSS